MKHFKELDQPQVFHPTIGPKVTTQNILRMSSLTNLLNEIL
jgi:hypothetical protein